MLYKVFYCGTVFVLNKTENEMKNITAVVFTVCFLSVVLNIGLVTKYVQIGKSDTCIPSMDMGDLQ